MFSLREIYFLNDSKNNNTYFYNCKDSIFGSRKVSSWASSAPNLYFNKLLMNSWMSNWIRDSIWVINSLKNYITEGQDLAWSGDAKFLSLDRVKWNLLQFFVYNNTFSKTNTYHNFVCGSLKSTWVCLVLLCVSDLCIDWKFQNV